MLFRKKKKDKGKDVHRPAVSPEKLEHLPVKIRVITEERINAPAIWDITLEITNKTEQTERFESILNVEGKIIEIPSNVRVVGKNKIAIENLVLQPKETIRITGLTITSASVPRITIEMVKKETPEQMEKIPKCKISIEKTIEPTGDEWFEVRIQIANASQSPISQLPFNDRVPSTFEVDRETINPRPKAFDILQNGDVLMKWELSLGPQETKAITYRVKARTPDAKISELYMIYER